MKPYLAADLFAGAGGASAALAAVCAAQDRPLRLVAVNHWELAVETHAANHPGARHHCMSVDAVSPTQAVPEGRLDLLLAGPRCTHHSTARGGKPADEQSRASAWCVLRWCTELRVDRVLIENVPEFLHWGPLGADGRPLKRRRGETFGAFIGALRSLGYAVEHRVLNAADFGDPTTRRRLFIQAARGRRPIHWPEPTHSREGGADLFGTRARWRAAREVIDWSLPGLSIFGRKRPLSANTMRRIAAGLARFGGAAFTVGSATTDKPGDPARCRPIDAPLPTLTGSPSHALVQPFVMTMSQSGSNGDRMRPAAEPIPTVTTADDLALVEPFMFGQQSGGAPRGVADPVPTVAASGAIAFVVPTNYGERRGQSPRCHSLEAPMPTLVGTGAHAFIAALRGTSPAQLDASVRDVGEPLPTVAAQGEHLGLAEPFLVNYHGTGGPQPVGEPLRTVDTRDRYGLVLPAGWDVLFRMLTPGELAAAMSFPANYIFKGSRADRVRQIGNAWAGETGKALCRAMMGKGAARDGH